jgi:DNA-directed RNA polymerase specialized sigma24 family protein
MSLDELLAATRAGDSKAREMLAGALYDVLRPRFRRSFSNAEAEDLVQSTLILIFRWLDENPEPPRSLESLVKAMARQVSLTARRSWARERDRRAGEPPNLVAPETSLVERLHRRERVARIVAAVEALDSTDQRAIEGWSRSADWRSRAAAEGVARSTLRTRVHRVLSKVRDLVHARAKVDREPSTA